MAKPAGEDNCGAELAEHVVRDDRGVRRRRALQADAGRAVAEVVQHEAVAPACTRFSCHYILLHSMFYGESI